MSYERQAGLPLRVYPSVLVAGVGGIGSWVGLNLALSGCVKTVYLCDPDVIESSNLNRTPYRLDQVGEKKVWALKDIIEERRMDVKVVPIPSFVQTAGMLFDGPTVVVDCTDGVSVKEWAKHRDLDTYIKLGYDGFGITYDGSLDTPWGASNGYRSVPSFIAPPQFMASLVVCELMKEEPSAEIITVNMQDVLRYMKEGEERGKQDEED